MCGVDTQSFILPVTTTFADPGQPVAGETVAVAFVAVLKAILGDMTINEQTSHLLIVLSAKDNVPSSAVSTCITQKRLAPASHGVNGLVPNRR